jgi:hypothetical protein
VKGGVLFSFSLQFTPLGIKLKEDLVLVIGDKRYEIKSAIQGEVEILSVLAATHGDTARAG